MKRIRIAIAVGADALTAVARVGATRYLDHLQVTELAPVLRARSLKGAGGELGHADDDGFGAAGLVAELESALERLRDRLAAAVGRPLGGARVRIVLLPPLVSARLIELPPLGRAEAEAVVQRSARRHFPLVTRASVVAVREPDGEAAGTGLGEGVRRLWQRLRQRLGRRADPGEEASDVKPTNWLAFGVDAEWIDAISAAVEGVGWRVDAVVPAHVAWLAAAESHSGGRSVDAVIAVEGGTAHLLRLDGTAVTALRRTPSADPVAVAAFLGRGRGNVALYADGETRSALRNALAANGWQVSGSVAGDESAAEYAHAASTELVSPGLAYARQRMRQRLAVRLGTAAVVILAAAGALELWDARRDLAELRAQRAAIREEVQPMTELMDSLHAFDARARAVIEVEAASPNWTPVLVELARILPRDSYIQRLHARGDTVSIQVVSGRAGPALAQLREARTLRNVELSGVVDRELEGGTTTSERFTVSALIARDTIDYNGGFGRLDGGGIR